MSKHARQYVPAIIHIGSIVELSSGCDLRAVFPGKGKVVDVGANQTSDGITIWYVQFKREDGGCTPMLAVLESELIKIRDTDPRWSV